MRRVYGVYFLRRLSHPALRVGAMLLLMLALRELVWVSSVFENISHKTDVVQFIQYGVLSFVGTEFIVQLVVLAAVFIVGFSVKEVLSYKQQRFA